MQVTIEYLGFFHINNVASGSRIETAPGSTVEEILDKLKVKPEDRTYMIPLINRQRNSFDTPLHDGDTLFLYFPVGGG